MTWVDNFSKLYGCGLQGIAKQAFSTCLWTGEAVRPYVGDVKVDLDSKSQVTVNVMPNDLFGTTDNMYFDAVISAMYEKDGRVVDDKTLMLMESSWCNRWNVCRVPLKPDPDVLDDAKLDVILSESRDGMINFRPTRIIDENIGSNRGLFTIIRSRFDAHHRRVADGTSRLDILNSDPNIFYRTLKV